MWQIFRRKGHTTSVTIKTKLATWEIHFTYNKTDVENCFFGNNIYTFTISKFDVHEYNIYLMYIIGIFLLHNTTSNYEGQNWLGKIFVVMTHQSVSYSWNTRDSQTLIKTDKPTVYNFLCWNTITYSVIFCRHPNRLNDNILTINIWRGRLCPEHHHFCLEYRLRGLKYISSGYDCFCLIEYLTK